MTSASVLKAKSPGDLVGLIPQLVGFEPSESLVALSLRGPRNRLGLTLRADLTDAPGLVQQVVRAMTADRARTCVLVVHTAVPTGELHPWSQLVDEVEVALAADGIEVTEALLVRGSSWWSYRCTAGCCPPAGTPIDRTGRLLAAVASEHAYEGRVVLPSRADLVSSLQPQLPLGPAMARRLQQQAVDDLAERLSAAAGSTVQLELERWRQALDAWEHQPSALAPADVAALVAALHVIAVRDVVASWGLARGDCLLGLLGQLCRSVVAPDDAPLCSVLAWVSYAAGNGALALIALERALATDPSYSLAELLLAAIDGLLPPSEVRAVLRRAG